MRNPRGKGLTSKRRALAGAGLLALAGVACAGGDRVAVPDRPGADKTAAALRAERRAFDGAPPVVPHEDFQIDCFECHDMAGMDVPGVGFAPPSPHEATLGMSAISRCQQCHVFSVTDAVFVADHFEGLPQNLRPGDRFDAWAPPRIPHPLFMRENCVACHTGPAAREEVRTSHPERTRCLQCHVQITVRESFEPGGDA